MFWDGTTPVESFSAGETTPGVSFCPGMEQPQGSPSALGWNDSGGVILFWDGMTLGESLSWDGTTTGESFCPGMERLQGSHSGL